MRFPPSFPARAQRGFSISELLVALAIGLVILAGMSTLFVNNTRAQGEIEKAHRQVENGRFAISLMAGDVRNAGFYAEFDPTVLRLPDDLPAPCDFAADKLREALPLHVQGADNLAAGTSGCLTDVRAGTDVLVVRHTATCVTGQPNCDPLSAGGPFFQASLCNNPSELDSGLPWGAGFYDLEFDAAALDRHKRDCTQVAGTGTLAQVRRYLTHIYFIANNSTAGDGIPTLKRAELGSAGFTIVPLVEGIENLQLEYGLDLAPAVRGDGLADQYAADPATAPCGGPNCAVLNWHRVVSVKLSLLARNIVPSAGYADGKSYLLGVNAAGQPNIIPASGDQYKRHVFQSVVALPNPAGRKFQ